MKLNNNQLVDYYYGKKEYIYLFMVLSSILLALGFPVAHYIGRIIK